MEVNNESLTLFQHMVIMMALTMAEQDPKILSSFPIYINFHNSAANNVPKFLANKGDVYIILQEQFDHLKTEKRGFSVQLYFEKTPCMLFIDYSSISYIEMEGVFKFNFNRKNLNIKNESEYVMKMLGLMQGLCQAVETNMQKGYNEGQEQLQEKKQTVFDIESIIKKRNN